jgi:hypothetical protein
VADLEERVRHRPARLDLDRLRSLRHGVALTDAPRPTSIARRHLRGEEPRRHEQPRPLQGVHGCVSARKIFLETTGNFASPENFRLVAQPSVILNALEGKTKVDYMRGRTVEAVASSAFRKAVDRLAARRGPDPAAWSSRPSTIAVPGQPAIPYSDRGTYIQIVELGARVVAGASFRRSGGDGSTVSIKLPSRGSGGTSRWARCKR